MNKERIIALALGAGIGGALVYWWIKRTCPCQHAHAGDATPASSSSGSDDASEDHPAVLLGHTGASSGAGASSSSSTGASSDALTTYGGGASSPSSCMSCSAGAASSIIVDPGPSTKPTGVEYANTGVTSMSDGGAILLGGH